MHGSVTLFKPARLSFSRKNRSEAALFLDVLRRLEAGRFQPFVDVRRRLGLPRSKQITFPLHPMRGLRCQFFEAYSLFREALLKRFLMFDAEAFNGHTRSPW